MNPCAECHAVMTGRSAAILVTEAWASPEDGLRSMQTVLCSHRCLLRWITRLVGTLDDLAALERMAALPPKETPR